MKTVDPRTCIKGTVLAILALAGTSSGLTAESQNAGDKPNVILIYADDLGYGDLSSYGATKVQTPHIDRLAREGRVFTDAHSASAVCTPSRYALLTGEYPFRQGTRGTWGPISHKSGLIVDTGKLTLGRLFKDAGYATASIGKWHLGFGKRQTDWNKPLRPGPLELGFDYYYGVPRLTSGYPYVYVENDRIVGWDPEDPLVFKGKPVSATSTFPATAGRKLINAFAGARKAHALYDDEEIASHLTAKAVDWITGHKTAHKDDPFFLYFPTTNIHHPLTPHPRFKGTSQCGLYGDSIHELDWMVGRLLKTLDDLGLAEKTLVIFTSDNGGMYNVPGKSAWEAGHRINGHLLGFKFGVWEGGHRVPFIARWPGRIKAGSRSDQLVSSLDMVATMAALLDRELEPGEAVDSFNMLETLTGKPGKPVRDHLILAPRDRRNLALRKGKWVYISAQGDGGQRLGDRGGPQAVAHSGSENSDVAPDGTIRQGAPDRQLYDLDADPSQTTNVIKDHPEIVSELMRLLDGYRNQSRTRDPPDAARAAGQSSR